MSRIVLIPQSSTFLEFIIMRRFVVCSVLALGLVATLAAVWRGSGSGLAAQQLSRQEFRTADRLLPFLDRVVNSVVDPDGPGAAVLVVKDGKVLLKKGYGMAEVEKKIPVTTATTFELASGSKPITALAILLLEMAGKLHLDDDVRKHVPELPIYDEKRPIRVVDLLQHTSGLPDPIGDGSIRQGSTADLVKWTADRKLLFATGSRHQYSNMNYRLLGLVAERVSGKSLRTYLHDEVFAPLGMNRTVVRESARIVPAGRARGYTVGGLLDGGKKYRLMENDFILVGEAGVWTCVDDMQKLDAAISSGRLLKAETLKRAWTRGKLDNGKEFDYGLGWRVEKDERGKRISHSGGWPGFMTHHLRLPEQKLTVIVLRNWFHLERGNSAIKIANRLATVVLDGPPGVNEPHSASQRKQLVGFYQAEKTKESLTATIVEGSGGLTLHLPMQEPYALVPAGRLRFALLGVGDGFSVQFALEGGKVVSLTLEQPKGMPTIVFRPTTGLAHAVKEFDKEMADKVAGKVWLGKLPATPDGNKVLRIAFRFTVQDGQLTGVLDDPDEGMGICGVELTQLRLTRAGMAFTWPEIEASYEGTLSADGTEIVGHWQQSGARIPLRFTPVN
jgi:CubicO group peptidase (beta-lactamase class C family)